MSWVNDFRSVLICYLSPVSLSMCFWFFNVFAVLFGTFVPSVVFFSSPQSPGLRHFTSSDPLVTYENRSNNHMRPLSRLVPKRLRYSLPVFISCLVPSRLWPSGFQAVWDEIWKKWLRFCVWGQRKAPAKPLRLCNMFFLWNHRYLFLCRVSFYSFFFYWWIIRNQ